MRQPDTTEHPTSRSLSTSSALGRALRMLAAMCSLLTLLHTERAYPQDTTCGIIWDPTVLLSDSNDDSYSPKVALSGEDVVHVTWEPGIRPRLPYRRSSDGGTTFGPIVELLEDSVSYPGDANWVQMVAEGPRVFVFFNGSTGSDTPVRMVRSTDAGMSWQDPVEISPGIAGEVRPAAISGDTLGIAYSSPTKRILRSTDGGDTWTRTNESLNYFARIALSPGLLHLVQLPPTVAEIEYRRSTDLGDTWFHQDLLSEADGLYSDLPAVGANGDSLVVCAWRETRYGCLTWVGCGVAGKTSSDGGTTFGPEVRLDDHPAGVNATVALAGNRVVVAWNDDLEQSGKARFSSDRGESWCGPATISHLGGEQIHTALSASAVHVVWVGPASPNPGTWRIFYRRGRFVETGVGGGGEGIPSAASLGQNYPNPFNPKTTIPYRIERRTDVTLRVLDLLGREVATLVAETREPGSYTTEWDAGDAPSGIYFYRLTAGGRVQTRKAVLLR